MKRTQLIFVLLLTLALAGSASTVKAQDKFEKKFGMTVSLQNGQSGFSLPWWVSQKVVFTPSIAFASLTDNGSNLELGMAIRFNQSTSQSVPYFGFRVGLDFEFPESGKKRTATLLGAMVGGEHFLDDHFSLGVEFQGNILFWKPGYYANDKNMTLLSTGAAALATYYF